MIIRCSLPNERLPFDRGRFKTVVHYVCWVCEDPRVLGPVKLGRILWYSERNTYLVSGKPLTGATFLKLSHGPSPRGLYAVLDELERDRVIAARRQPGELDTMRYFATARPDISGITAEQLSNLECVIRAVCFGADTEVPHRHAHDQILAAAAVGETIPHYTAFAGLPGNIHEADIAWATSQAQHPIKRGGLHECDELRSGNLPVREALAALMWHLVRTPGAGISLPTVPESFFLYKQAKITLSVPDISILYSWDLDEFIVDALYFAFDQEDGSGETDL